MKNYKVGVIGLGYVGLPLALNFSKNSNFTVYGIDTDKSKIEKLKKCESYINYIPTKLIKKFIKKNKVSSDFSIIPSLDMIIMCLPTPVKKNNKPDLSFITGCCKKISQYLRKGQLLCLESTTYPGTTDEILISMLRKKFKIGKNFYVAYSSEREDPGNKIKMENIPKVISGHTKNCKNKAYFYYSKVFKKIVLTDQPKIAEFSKILENVFRSINIGLVNEVKIICDKMGLDVFEVIKAASTKPFGFMPFYPGPGMGGHCIPLDPFYLKWKANKYGLKTKFIELAYEINNDMKKWIIQKIKNKLKKIKNKKILIIGASYKKNIDDCRESPSLDIISSLIKLGGEISYHDPYVKVLPITRKHKITMQSTSISKKNIKNFDGIVILTDHDNINYKIIKNYSKTIFDSRGIFKPSKNVIRI